MRVLGCGWFGGIGCERDWFEEMVIDESECGDGI